MLFIWQGAKYTCFHFRLPRKLATGRVRLADRSLALSRYSQRAFPFEQGRVRIIKPAVERVRGEIA